MCTLNKEPITFAFLVGPPAENQSVAHDEDPKAGHDNNVAELRGFDCGHLLLAQQTVLFAKAKIEESQALPEYESESHKDNNLHEKQGHTR